MDPRVPELRRVLDEHIGALEKLTKGLGLVTRIIEAQTRTIAALEERVRVLETQTETKGS